MSMKYYGLNDYGMVIDEKTGKIICNKIVKNYDESGDDWRNILWEEGICGYISEFTGEAIKIKDDGSDDYYHPDDYDDDVISYIGLKIPQLFQKVYNNIDEMVDELRERLGEYLPNDYDYRSRIRHICGTFYG